MLHTPVRTPAVMSQQEGASIFGSLSLPDFADCWKQPPSSSLAPGCHHGVSRAGLTAPEKGRSEEQRGQSLHWADDAMCTLTDGSAVSIYHS